MLAGLGEDVKISTRDIAACKEFIRTVMYQGEPKDSYLQTRMNLYDEQAPESKTTITIPPDEQSCTQHILCCHYRVYSWKRSNESVIPDIDMFENGWKLSADGMVVPVWYAGPQLPPSCKKPPRKKASKETDGYEADIEHTSEQKTKSKRKKKTSKTVDEDEEQEKRLKLEREEKGKAWRKKQKLYYK